MDLAEQIDDFIPSVQSGHSEMDSLIMLMFILTITSIFLLWLGRFLYQKYVVKKAAANNITSATTSTTTSAAVASSPLVKKAATATSSPASRGGASQFTSSAINSKSRSLSQQSLVRKRLSRRSPGPEINQPRRSRSIPPPASVAGPDDVTSTWTSHVFKWLYSDMVIVNDLFFGFITAINQTLARNATENGILIEVVRVLPESTTPNISNVFCDKSQNTATSEVVVTMDVETTVVLQIKAFRRVGTKTDVLHYRVTIRFKGHLSIAMNYTTLIGEMRIEGYPDVKINIASIGPIKTTGKEENEMLEMINEALNLTIREVIYPIDFSVHSTCPRALKMEPDNHYDNGPMEFPNPFDYMQRNSVTSQSYTQPRGMGAATRNRRLLVKIVKGEGLSQARESYITVEMDEPPQKNQTGARTGVSPFWDEHFLFELSERSSEILFEVYDRSTGEFPKFLGLGLVGIDELAVGPSSSQIIALQPRPYETEAVFGAITVEFVFIDGAMVPQGRRPYKLKEALKIDPNQNDQLSYEAPTHNINPQHLSPMLQRQKPQMNGQNQQKNVNPNSISPRTTSPSFDSNSLKPINYSSPQHHINSANTTNGNRQYPYDKRESSPMFAKNLPATSTPNQNQMLNVKISMIGQQKNLSAERLTGSLAERGREKKKTSIFGTLRKRLSRSRNRNDGTNGTTEGHDQFDSKKNNFSTDTALKNASLKSNTSGPMTKYIPGLSRRSSLSEMSGVSRMSSISNKTFLHEASSLVLEVVENGVKRHYLVPMNMAQKPRWRRKGTKLHIFNDHTFIAKHLPSGLICEICMQTIPFRMGKQAYECRDCSLKCHKQCHVHSPQLCPKPTIQSIELCTISETGPAMLKF